MRDLIGGDCCTRHLDHSAYQVVYFDLVLFHHLGGHAVHDRKLVGEFGAETDEGNHNLGFNLDSLLAFTHLSRCLEKGACLHFSDLRVDDAKSTAAAAEHGVLFVKGFNAIDNEIERHAEFLC